MPNSRPNLSRRDLSLLLPALLALPAEAAPSADSALPSKCYDFTQLPVKTNATTHNESRNVFWGHNRDNYEVDLHITTLAPGQMPHPEHHHPHEEVTMIQTGTLEATISGRTCRVGPGSVIYVASNEPHHWKNVGDTPAQYFVIALGQVKAG